MHYPFEFGSVVLGLLAVAWLAGLWIAAPVPAGNASAALRILWIWHGRFGLRAGALVARRHRYLDRAAAGRQLRQDRVPRRHVRGRAIVVRPCSRR